MTARPRQSTSWTGSCIPGRVTLGHPGSGDFGRRPGTPVTEDLAQALALTSEIPLTPR